MHEILNKVDRVEETRASPCVSLDSLQTYYVVTSNRIFLLNYTLVRSGREAPSYTQIIKSLHENLSNIDTHQNSTNSSHRMTHQQHYNFYSNLNLV